MIENKLIYRHPTFQFISLLTVTISHIHISAHISNNNQNTQTHTFIPVIHTLIQTHTLIHKSPYSAHTHQALTRVWFVSFVYIKHFVYQIPVQEQKMSYQLKQKKIKKRKGMFFLIKIVFTVSDTLTSDTSIFFVLYIQAVQQKYHCYYNANVFIILSYNQLFTYTLFSNITISISNLKYYFLHVPFHHQFPFLSLVTIASIRLTLAISFKGISW